MVQGFGGKRNGSTQTFQTTVLSALPKGEVTYSEPRPTEKALGARIYGSNNVYFQSLVLDVLVHLLDEFRVLA